MGRTGLFQVVGWCGVGGELEVVIFRFSSINLHRFLRRLLLC